MKLFGQQVIGLISTDSTNRYALQIIEEHKAINGMAILTDHQKSGMGYGSNHWESEPHKNLTVTFIYKPSQVLAADQFSLNKSVSLALHDMLMALNLPEHFKIKIKWPNDAYVDDKKIAGVLINNIIRGDLIEYSVIGIGLNINQIHFGTDIPNPVSIKMLTGENYDVHNMFRLLCHSMDKWFDIFSLKEFELINSEYQQNLYKLDEKSCFMADHIKFEGIIRGVDKYGMLILEVEGVRQDFAFKEVEYVI